MRNRDCTIGDWILDNNTTNYGITGGSYRMGLGAYNNLEIGVIDNSNDYNNIIQD